MKQPHTESAIEHTDGQQNTGNHLNPSSGLPGSDKLGGTRAGAENVEGGAKRDAADKPPQSGEASKQDEVPHSS